MAPGPTTSQPAYDRSPADSTRLESRLVELRAAVDRLLSTWPRDGEEAAARVAKELGFDPTEEELRALCRMATDPVRKGLRHDWPRRLLALRAAALAELRVVWRANRPDPDPRAIRRAGATVPSLLAAGAVLERELSDSLAAEDLRLLIEIHSVLGLPERELHAAGYVAERIAELVERAHDPEELRRRLPALAPEEAELVRRALGEADDGTRAARSCVDALALRTVMVEDLRAAREVTRGGTDTQRLQLTWQRARGRLMLASDAYHMVANRLQQQQISSTMLHRRDVADQLRAVGRTLYEAYRQILPIVGIERGTLPVSAAPSSGPGATT